MNRKKTDTNLNFKSWGKYEYELPSNIVTEKEINEAISNFHEDVLKPLDNNQQFLIILKIQTSGKVIRSISTLQKINKLECSELIKVFLEYWNLKEDNYTEIVVESIILNYLILDRNVESQIDDNNKSKKGIIDVQSNPKTKTENTINLLKIGSFNFPLTMDLFEWGSVDFILNDQEAIVYKKHSSAQYHIKFNENKMEIKYILNNKVLVSFTDELLDKNNLGTFKRIIKNQTFYIENSKIISQEKLYTFPFIKPIKPKPFLINKYLVMDIETMKINDRLYPYAVSIYDGKNYTFFYLSDYENSQDLLISCIKSLMLRKYHGYKIYLHNFSNFDGVFLLNILIQLSDNIKPIINDGRLIDISFKYAEGKYTLHFRDSLLMLPASLKKLARQFNVIDKGIFPYKFPNKDNLNYNGAIPAFQYYEGITESQYIQYIKDFKEKTWNLRKQTELYCNQDCFILYEVLDQFFKENFDNTRLNGSNYYSLPSLTFANFRCRFMSDNTNIPIIKGEIFKFIKLSYSGGAVDVYKPYGKNIYRYDVNSLYPYIMANYPMPIGNPKLLQGNSSLIEQIIFDPNKFSFVEVDVFCPANIKAPLLLHRYNNKTLAGIGRWTGVYTSIEIIRAIELGYKFTYKKIVYFDSKIIFKDYVNFYYNIKLHSEKNSSSYTISKLMLNSLYGRFGMNPYLNHHVIKNTGYAISLFEKNIITDVLPLMDGKELISYFNEDLDEFHNDNSLSSISIAAAITAGARTYMSYFKNMKGINLFYSDTDSLDIDRPLPEEFLGNKLGQFKLEYKFEEVVYLGPKIYGGRTSDLELTKVKGLKNKVSFNDLKSLLKKGSTLLIKNEKWYKDFNKGNIFINNENYTLSIPDSKREIIYDKNNNFIETRPIIFDK